MATVDGLTKERMLAIEAESITDARVDPVTHHLILTTHGGTDIDVGSVQGPPGIQGPFNPNAADLSATGLQVFQGAIHVPSVEAGLTGTNGRYIGVTNGPPTAGAHNVGDFANDITNKCIWSCTTAGTPGTWVRLSRQNLINGGPPTIGTWVVGDVVLDTKYAVQWLCTAGGTPGSWFAMGTGLCQFQAHLANPQSIGSGGTPAVTYDAIDYDPLNLWNPSTHQWQAPLTGMYAVTIMTQWETNGTGIRGASTSNNYWDFTAAAAVANGDQAGRMLSTFQHRFNSGYNIYAAVLQNGAGILSLTASQIDIVKIG